MAFVITAEIPSGCVWESLSTCLHGFGKWILKSADNVDPLRLNISFHARFPFMFKSARRDVIQYYLCIKKLVKYKPNISPASNM